MFGRRRRPLLGTAVVIGASRSAARHDMAYQGQVAAGQQQAAQLQAELQMREEQDRERRTQAAINEAIAKEAKRVNCTNYLIFFKIYSIDLF